AVIGSQQVPPTRVDGQVTGTVAAGGTGLAEWPQRVVVHLPGTDSALAGLMHRVQHPAVVGHGQIHGIFDVVSAETDGCEPCAVDIGDHDSLGAASLATGGGCSDVCTHGHHHSGCVLAPTRASSVWATESARHFAAMGEPNHWSPEAANIVPVQFPGITFSHEKCSAGDTEKMCPLKFVELGCTFGVDLARLQLTGVSVAQRSS